MRQLALPVSLPDDVDFANFLAVTEVGAQAQRLLQAGLAPGSLACLWGAPGTGKTHLALASCRGREQALYLPLAALCEQPPTTVLQDLDGLDLLVLDEIDAVAGSAVWEEALFHLHNRLLGSGGRMLVAARAAPRALSIALPDLRSRLLAGVGFGLPSHDDEQLQEILQFRAKRFGLSLGVEAGRYLLRRLPRELGVLIEQLRKLDRAALADQRQLSVPFIKRVLELD